MGVSLIQCCCSFLLNHPVELTVVSKFPAGAYSLGSIKNNSYESSIGSASQLSAVAKIFLGIEN